MARRTAGSRRPGAGVAGACWGLALALLPASVHAHPAAPVVPGELWRAWTFDPWVVVPMAVSMLLYGRGVTRLWSRAGRYRGVRRGQVWCFVAGNALLVLALVAPLHALGGALFSAHMSQHIVLMGLAAPLLVMGAPLTAWLWGLPAGARRGAGAMLAAGAVRRPWQWLRQPAVAWLVHTAAIWVWHVPALYSATLSSDLVHTAQHASFMGAAVLFFWSLQARAVHGAAVLYLFTTAVHSSVLGALLTFSPQVHYTPYLETAPAWGLTPLEDQQVGGLLMWVPAGALYFAAALAALASWLRSSERRSARQPSVTTQPLG